MRTRISTKLLVLTLPAFVLLLSLSSDVSAQPASRFPWQAGVSWHFTGGPHDWDPGTRSGLDFAPGDTSAVLAVADGQVYYSGWYDWGHGDNLNVRVRHGDGWETWYLHLSSSAFGEDGELVEPVSVSQGAYIGEVGNTGAAGVHIHIELVQGGGHPSWDGMTINNWLVHKDCTGGPENCESKNFGGYIEHINTNEQKLPNKIITKAPLVESSNALSNAPVVVSGSPMVHWVGSVTNECSGEFGLYSPRKQVIFSNYNQEPAETPVFLGPFDPGTSLVFYIKPASYCGGKTYLSTSANARVTLGGSYVLFIGWEDLPYAQADKDFDDLVIEVEYASPKDDQEAPAANWVGPVSNGEKFDAACGLVPLKVNASDVSGISRVAFHRWDAVRLVDRPIETDRLLPFQSFVDVGTLNMEWNEINADVYDNAGNQTNQFIWIYRVPVNAANKLCNPSFELDVNKDTHPDSWRVSRLFTRSKAIAANTGTYVGRFHATDNSGSATDQVVPNIVAGKIYDFSGLVRIPKTSDRFSFKVEVIWLNAQNQAISTPYSRSYAGPTNGWHEPKARMVAPPGAKKAMIRMAVSSLNATIYVDRFRLIRP